MRVPRSLDSSDSRSCSCGIVGNVPYNMGEESVFPLPARTACPERPTGTADRRLQICRSSRGL